MDTIESEKRKKIFKAAAHKFSHQGVDGATMQEIADAAGVGKGTLYRYFDDKADLISSLAEIGFDRIAKKIETGIKGVDDPKEQLEKAVEIQLKFYNQYRDVCRFLTRESLGYKDKFERQIKRIRKGYTVAIEDIIARGIEKGEFKDIDLEVAATNLIGALNITVLHWFMFKDEFPVEKLRKGILEVYFEGIKAE